MHELTKMFSLRIDLHSQIGLERCFRIFSIPSPEMKKQSGGGWFLPAVSEGGQGTCVLVHGQGGEVTLQTALPSRSAFAGRGIRGRKGCALHSAKVRGRALHWESENLGSNPAQLLLILVAWSQWICLLLVCLFQCSHLYNGGRGISLIFLTKTLKSEKM